MQGAKLTYWIANTAPARLGTAARPRGGDWLESEMSSMRREGVDILVSLLTPHESSELDLTNEATTAAEAGIEFRNFPIPDRETPTSAEAFRAFVTELHQESQKGRSIVAHCRAGIGRSSLLTASLLTLNGHSAKEAFRLISAARGMQVPDTVEQVEWLREFSFPAKR